KVKSPYCGDNLNSLLTDASADDPAYDADARLGQIGLLRLMGAVTQSDVRDLVRQHARQLPFVARVVEHSAVDENEPARKSERVDVRLIDDTELIREIRTSGVRREPVPDSIHVIIHRRII